MLILIGNSDAAVGAILEIICIAALYWIPTYAAFRRKHKSRQAIALVNFFFGWTVLGWFAAVIWAFTGNLEQPANGGREVDLRSV